MNLSKQSRKIERMNASLRNFVFVMCCSTVFVGCQTTKPMNGQPIVRHMAPQSVHAGASNTETAKYTRAGGANSQVQQASAQSYDEQPQIADNQVEQASYVTPLGASQRAVFQGRMGQAVSRQSACGCPSCNTGSQTYCPVYTDLGESCPPPSERTSTQWIDPQEYIFDGGDREPWVVVRNDGEVAGLQPEDTVIHYETKSGDTFVEPACRTPIYSPRFAAVRKITTTRESDVAVSPYAARQPIATGLKREALPPLKVRQPIRALPEKGVRVVEAFRDRNRGIPVERTIPTLGFEDAVLPYADIQFLRTGLKHETDIVKLQRGVAAAREWASEESIQVIIDGEEAAIMKEEKATSEIVLYDYRGKPCIRICKVASHQIAAPGDEIEFTIRFDNTGVEAVDNVVILDSLAPRLEYIEDSQKSSIATGFSTTENAAGSSVLRWELEKPMGSGEGGYIRFRCRVR
jgi:uncharacterized repeat protein (TIGR01451 family)